MRIAAKYALVFNRKKEKLGSEDKSLIQVRVTLVRYQHKYIGTGVYVRQDQWDGSQIINHPAAAQYNQSLNNFIGDLQKFEISLINNGKIMTADDLDEYLGVKGVKDASFVAYMKDQVEKRNDLVAGVKSKHLLVVTELETRSIKYFSDLTFAKIQDYDRWLRDQGYAQPTIHKRHCVVKVYIHMAEKAGLLPYGKNPYMNFSVSRGKHKIRERLDDREIDTLASKEIVDPVLSAARDRYMFQIYTGISYKDLRVLSYKTNIRYNDDGIWIEGLRKKNGEYYSIYLIPEAIEIMDRYKSGDLLFQAPDVWRQNDLMFTVKTLTGIGKSLTSHTARHTAATLMVRKGLPIEYIRDILGHVSTETTEIYARIEKQGIRDQMKKLSKKAP